MTVYAIRPDEACCSEDRVGCSLAWREWGDEWVVYDGANGSSHLLDSVAGGLLGSLLASPDRGLPLTELFGLAFGADEPPHDDELHHVWQVLGDLERIGLIRQCPP